MDGGDDSDSDVDNKKWYRTVSGENVMITGGCSQALDQVCSLLTEPSS